MAPTGFLYIYKTVSKRHRERTRWTFAFRQQHQTKYSKMLIIKTYHQSFIEIYFCLILCVVSGIFYFINTLFSFLFLFQNKPLSGDCENDNNNCRSGDSLVVGGCKSLSTNSWLKSRTTPVSRTGSGSSAVDMNVQIGSAGSPTLRLASVKVYSFF